ncbi:helix-turn-helix domain-containing protein [Actinacidiphila guanduensis]|uniref:Sugar-specific transcriptional regulator TrmB n=1 Tax=Actinacidiphila guanduensis TaxID=310781 RepID=A0A1H0GWI9_9ACTN|nr:helix-turn-helix domain-containing protein [Actinacidiphila guanduensis]SDO11218.1 Sugar-specific transcriptional regulator TrmB [Actinacidiphila guanduensis]
MLAAVGLTGEQQAVYLALLDGGPATAAQVRERVAGARVAPALSALETKGLISRLAGRPVRYQPARPDMAMEVLVRAQEQELQRVRAAAAGLMERFRAGQGTISPTEIVEVVTTREATLQRWAQLQRSARTEVRAFDRPPYVEASGTNPIEYELLPAGIRYRTVYDRSGLELPGRLEAIRHLVDRGEQARVAVGVPVKMFLADNTLGLISLDRPASSDSALVIHPSSLLDTLIALFEAVWVDAVPMRFDAAGAADGPRREEYRTLLGLLAAGLTDQAIARQMGWHPRTAQRHVRELLAELGARTRFQAGLQAGRRGWL